MLDVVGVGVGDSVIVTVTVTSMGPRRSCGCANGRFGPLVTNFYLSSQDPQIIIHSPFCESQNLPLPLDTQSVSSRETAYSHRPNKHRLAWPFCRPDTRRECFPHQTMVGVHLIAVPFASESGDLATEPDAITC